MYILIFLGGWGLSVHIIFLESWGLYMLSMFPYVSLYISLGKQEYMYIVWESKGLHISNQVARLRGLVNVYRAEQLGCLWLGPNGTSLYIRPKPCP